MRSPTFMNSKWRLAAVSVAVALTAGGAALATTGAVQAATDAANTATAVQPVVAVAPPDVGVAADAVANEVTAAPTDADTLTATDDLAAAGEPVPVVAAPAADAAAADTVTLGATLKCAGPAPAGQERAYQWLRDDAAIPGATNCDYTVVLDDIGHQVALKTTITPTGADPYTTTSTPFTVVKADFVLQLGTLTGTATVGEMVQLDAAAKACSYYGSIPPTVVYTWLRDGAAIPDASTINYQLTPDDAGHQVALQVSCTAPGHNDASATTPPTATVAKADLTIISLTISSQLTVGQAGIKAGYQIDSYYGFGNTPTFAWQWLRDGQAIPGATGVSYTVVGADLGHALSVRMTVSLPGYNDAVKVSNATVVDDSSGPRLANVRIIGTPVYTATIAATWDTAVGAVSYQWLRDGAPIAGATLGNYKLTLDDIDHQVAVRVTATVDGYDPVTQTSAAVTAQPGTLTITSVTIPSPIKVGDQLHAGSAGVPQGATLTWQWFRNGQPIAGATSADYTVVSLDSGASLMAQLTAAIPGYTSAVKLSNAVPVGANPVLLTDIQVTGTLKVGQRIQVEFTGQQGATYTYQWLRDGQPILGETNQAYMVTSDDQNHNLSVTVTGTAPGYDPATVTTTPVLMWDLQALLQPLLDMLRKWLAQLMLLFGQ